MYFVGIPWPGTFLIVYIRFPDIKYCQDFQHSLSVLRYINTVFLWLFNQHLWVRSLELIDDSFVCYNSWTFVSDEKVIISRVCHPVRFRQQNAKQCLYYINIKEAHLHNNKSVIPTIHQPYWKKKKKMHIYFHVTKFSRHRMLCTLTYSQWELIPRNAFSLYSQLATIQYTYIFINNL